MREKKTVINKIGIHLENRRVSTFFLVLYDVLAVNAAYFFALWLRFDCKYGSITGSYLKAYLYFVPVYSVLCVLVFAGLRLYRSIWRFASYSELIRVGISTVITSLIQIVGTVCVLRALYSNGFDRMPISYYFFGTVLQFFFVLAVRFAYRFVESCSARKRLPTEFMYGFRLSCYSKRPPMNFFYHRRPLWC